MVNTGMHPFQSLTSCVIPLPFSDVDTDQIIPARYLKVTDKAGLAEGLFSGWRYLPDGSSDPDFPLNQAAYQGCQILLAGDNFACGSSREHAPWALAEYGFRAIVAPSFADIFYGNCCQNGLLPVRLAEAEVAELFRRADAAPEGYELTVDLERQRVTDGAGFEATFSIDPYRREMLLRGLDEIGRTLLEEPTITAFERGREAVRRPA